MTRCWDKGKTKIVGGHFEKWQPFCFWDKSAMALYLKIFVRPNSIIVPNFKFLSQSARFPQILTDSSPANKTATWSARSKRRNIPNGDGHKQRLRKPRGNEGTDCQNRQSCQRNQNSKYGKEPRKQEENTLLESSSIFVLLLLHLLP